MPRNYRTINDIMRGLTNFMIAKDYAGTLQQKEGKKWQPQTMEEALEFEREKAKIKAGIDEEGEDIDESMDVKQKARFKPAPRPSLLNAFRPTAAGRGGMPFALNPATALKFYKNKMSLRPRSPAPATPQTGQPGAVTLPSSVKSTSQAVEYLMENQGMNKMQAITYLRALNAK